MQDGGSADGEADDSSQCGHQHEIGTEVKQVGCYGGDGEDDSQYVQPQRSAYSGACLSVRVLAQAELQQESGESDRRYDNEGERTGKSGTAGVDHHQSEREQEQSGGDDRPAARLGLGLGPRGRVGSGVGQGVPSQVIQGGAQGFQMGGIRATGAARSAAGHSETGGTSERSPSTAVIGRSSAGFNPTSFKFLQSLAPSFEPAPVHSPVGGRVAPASHSALRGSPLLTA